MRSVAALGLLAWVALAQAAGAQATREPKLSVKVAPGSSPAGALTVGDRTVVTLELTLPSAGQGEPRFPSWGKTWGDAEVVGVGPVERSGGGSGETTFRQRITVAAFRTGRVPLPPVAVIVPRSGGGRAISTPPGLALQVASVIPGDPKKATPKPPAAPRSLPWGRRFWWTFAGMSALAVALGIGVFARRRVAEIAAAALPPLEELERELTRIAAGLGAVEGAGAPARVAAALSSALRRYLGRELTFPALESTTTEIQRRLRADQTPEGISRTGIDLLRRLDRIKFSRREAALLANPDHDAGAAIFSEAIAAARSVAADLDRHRRPAALPEPTVGNEQVVVSFVPQRLAAAEGARRSEEANETTTNERAEAAR
jgi:hypothetical protein